MKIIRCFCWTAGLALLFCPLAWAQEMPPPGILAIALEDTHQGYLTQNPGNNTVPLELPLGSGCDIIYMGGDTSGDGADDIIQVSLSSEGQLAAKIIQSPAQTEMDVRNWTSSITDSEKLSFYFLPGDFNADSREDLATFYLPRSSDDSIVYAKITFGDDGSEQTSDAEDWRFPNERSSAFVAGSFMSLSSSNDAFQDIAAISESGSDYLARFYVGPNGQLNDTTWTFSNPGGNPVAFRSGDVNDDGSDDLIAVFYNPTSTNYTARVVFGPDGAVVEDTNLGSTPYTDFLTEDFDEDGFLDIAGISSTVEQRSATVYMGQSTGLSSSGNTWELTDVPDGIGAYLGGTFSAETFINGWVMLGETPIEGATVQLTRVGELNASFVTTTDENGVFSFNGLEFGEYEAVIIKDGLIVATGSVTIQAAITEFVLSATEDTPRLENPAFSMWNSFLEMKNVLEVFNRSAEDITATITIKGLSGSIRTPTILSASTVTIEANSQYDVLLDELVQIGEDSYGVIEVASTNNGFDGRVTQYRLDADDPETYDFAFTTPLTSSLGEDTFVSFNTFYPSVDTSIDRGETYNWLSVANLDDVARSFSVTYYDRHGNTFASRILNLPGDDRFDIDGGHELFGPDEIGSIKVSPLQEDTRYLATMNKYGRRPLEGNFAFGMAAVAREGNQSAQFVPILHLEDSANYIEVVNTEDSSADIRVRFFDLHGNLVDDFTRTLVRHQIIHINASSRLTLGDMGTVEISSTDGSKILVQGSVYHYDEESNKLASVELSPAQEPIADSLHGSYNLFLETANWLRLHNVTNQSQTITMTLFNGSESTAHELVVPPFGARSYPLHDFSVYQLAGDTYGGLSLRTQDSARVIAEVLRARPGKNRRYDFTFTTPVR